MELRQGIELTSVRRISKAIAADPSHFFSQVFTPQEQKDCRNKVRQFEHYAARYAAKEAFRKALRLPRRNRFPFRDIEVRKKASGKPFLFVKPDARKYFGLPPKARVELSLTHERELAMAAVLIVLP